MSFQVFSSPFQLLCNKLFLHSCKMIQRNSDFFVFVPNNYGEHWTTPINASVQVFVVPLPQMDRIKHKAWFYPSLNESVNLTSLLNWLCSCTIIGCLHCSKSGCEMSSAVNIPQSTVSVVIAVWKFLETTEFIKLQSGFTERRGVPEVTNALLSNCKAPNILQQHENCSPGVSTRGLSWLSSSCRCK